MVSRRGSSVAGVLAIVLLLASGLAAPAAPQQPEFPHEEHTRLFPLCTGCHEGVPGGDEARYPQPSLCANCHDGDELEQVEWEGPSPRESNLEFDHAEHARAADEEDLACADCHTDEGARRMAVQRPLPARCMSCHAHRAESHYADAECSTCHRPLARSEATLARIEDLPRPESHEADGFLERDHGRAASADVASCRTCHTRERCTSCHVDGDRVEAIVAIEEAPEGTPFPTYEGRYPLPESHRSGDWVESHGDRASVAECSTCHTRQSCTSCHQSGSPPEAVAGLVDGDSVPAPGVRLALSAPPSHASPFFEIDHGTAASAGTSSCTTCHTESTCTSCHASEREAGFHPPDFLAQHASQAYGRRLECSNCHDTAVFCRSCHEQLGMGSQGRLGGGFHDGQSLWLLRHGQAARQQLESCASCHRQTDCLQCHSELGAFKVNPHGDMDLERFAERNREICFACHLDDPLRENNP